MTIKLNWIAWLALAAFIVVMLLLARSCKSETNHKDDSKQVSAMSVEAEVNNNELKAYKDSVLKSLTVNKHQRDSLNSALATTKQKLSNSQAQVSVLTKMYYEAKDKADTGQIVGLCDDLVVRYDEQGKVLDSYKEQNDSLSADYERSINTQAALAARQDSAYITLFKSNQFTVDKYNSLFTDYTKQRKRSRWDNILIKVGPIAGVVVGLFIGKQLK